MVGVLGVHPNAHQRTAHTVEIGMLVGEGWRGRGIGRILMTVMLDWAFSVEEIEKVCLAVFHTNQAAISLYESMGFEPEGCRRGQFRIQGN